MIDSSAADSRKSLRIAIVTDAWRPQVNGVVRTLTETKRELELAGHTVEMVAPELFTTFPCPTYPEIRLSLAGAGSVGKILDRFAPDAVHIATEGPLGWAARKACLTRGLPFTTAYHTRFPEYVEARTKLPVGISYSVLRRFHAPASRVLVPTPTVKADLDKWGFKNVVLWTRGVDLEIFKPGPRDRLQTKPPIFVYVGRVAVEKNVEAFLALDLPGSKWVVGEGPAMASLKAKYPTVSYLGVLQQKELASVYAAADVFVFPSKTDTFGLVLLEAMACGTPVAAFPVTGPLDVLGDVPPDQSGGAMDDDLRVACLRALEIPRERARAHAMRYSWAECARQFADHLRPRNFGGPTAAAAE